MRLEVIQNGKPVPKAEQKAVLIAASQRLHTNAMTRRALRAQQRFEGVPERQSLAIAMLAVEERLVKAFWTIARQPAKRLSPSASQQCGVEYFHDRNDTHARYADAPGGKWEQVAPRPSIPSGKEIDAADEAMDWLLFVDEGMRKILVAGATFKRGDAGRNINWTRVRLAVPSLVGYSERTLRHRYREALRTIALQLTLLKVA